MGIHTRTFETADPQRLERLAKDASAAAERAEADVRTVMRQLTHRLAAGGDCEEFREVAKRLAKADTAAAEAIAAARYATEAADRGDVQRVQELSVGAQGHAVDARLGADRAMELLPHG